MSLRSGQRPVGGAPPSSDGSSHLAATSSVFQSECPGLTFIEQHDSGDRTGGRGLSHTSPSPPSPSSPPYLWPLPSRFTHNAASAETMLCRRLLALHLPTHLRASIFTLHLPSSTAEAVWLRSCQSSSTLGQAGRILETRGRDGGSAICLRSRCGYGVVYGVCAGEHFPVFFLFFLFFLFLSLFSPLEKRWRW